ncbi:MAG: aminopeptidase P family protein [Deltaproteobacteria bacterium]|nr:aminopeptidase P family protein [Deltaproteobacteria bacterium]
METLHTVLNRGCSIWDRERVSEDEFRSRLGHVRRGMEERDVDLLLVYGDSRRFGQLAFVSHFMPKNRGALAVIPRQGEPALVVQEPSRNNPFSKTLTWINEVRSVGQFAQGLGDALKARELKPERVGLVSVQEQLNIREWNGLAKLLDSAELCDLSDFLASLRLVKSPAEQNLLKETNRILEQALARFEKEARVGQKEYEVMALVEREARRQGVEDFRFLIARSSEPEVGLRPAAPFPIRKGEALLVAVAASYQRYWAELGRTFCLGSPGNGVGLELDEAPFLGREGSGKIQPGMVLTLRVCLAGKECGSALISQPFLVQHNGLQPLATPVEELVLVES